MTKQMITLLIGSLIGISCTHGKLVASTRLPEPQLSLKAFVSSGGSVTFVVRLSNPEALGCPAVEWQFGDGCQELIQDFSCSSLPKIWSKPHQYRQYGDFRPTIYLRSQETGTILEMAQERVVFVPPGEDF